jgi:hypothetical protein
VSVTPAMVDSMAADVAELWRLAYRAASEVDEQSFVQATFNYVAQLDADRTWVYSGTRTYAWWKAKVDEERRVIQSTLSDVAASSFGNVLWDTARETGTTVVEGGADVVAAAKSGPVWGIVFAALGAFIFWKVSR